MFHSRTSNNRINKLHESALRIAYKNSNLSFQELLDPDNSFTIHHKNLQKLVIEMYKIKQNLSPKLISELSTLHNSSFNLRNNRCWKTSNVRTVAYGTETLLFREEKTWNLIPEYIKIASTLNEFKNKIKHWESAGCTCRLCKVNIVNLGFI